MPPQTFLGVEILDFDPDDPHCWECERHLGDGDTPIAVALVLLTHQATGEEALAVCCIDCAEKHDLVVAIHDARTGHPELLN